MYFRAYDYLDYNEVKKGSNLFDKVGIFYNEHQSRGNQLYIVTLTAKRGNKRDFDKTFIPFRKKIMKALPSEAYGGVEHKGDHTGWHGHFLMAVHCDLKLYKVQEIVRDCWAQFHAKYIGPAPLDPITGQRPKEQLTSVRLYDESSFADRGWRYIAKTFKKDRGRPLACVKPRGHGEHYQRSWGVRKKAYWGRGDLESTKVRGNTLKQRLHDKTNGIKTNNN